MKTAGKIFSVIFLFTSTLCGALPPLAQNFRELQAILSDPRTLELLGSAERFDSISKIDTGYLIETRNHSLQIDVEYLSSHRIGPAPFTLHFIQDKTD
jgi:hypothetical protein